jgi:AmmeMemoRadiSam system protein B/AmmeMemoRadiSam system protein A
VFLAAFVTLAAGLWSATSIPADEPPASENVNAKARAPAVAGRFYPNEAEALELAVRGFLADAVAPRGQRPVALIAPHAGYIYSAQIAADAYRQAMEHDYDLVVILGTNHTEAGFGGVSVHPGPGYRTPLGVAEIDEIVAAALIEADPAFTFEPAVHRREHSVEVQIPFVQIAFPEVKIVTAVIGRPDPGLCARFGKALAKVLDGRAALIVASSDFSHYPAYDDAKATDLAVLDAIADLNPRTVRDEIRRQMARDVPGLATCACGEAPILAAIAAARALGATHGCLISYANSGDSPLPDRSRVVGYGAMAMIAGACPKQRAQKVGQTAPLEHRPLDALAGRELLAFARESISRYLITRTAPLAREFAPDLWRKQGAFVTLRKHGELRGCIGHSRVDLPLCQVVGAMALQAAFNDRRFPPLRADELNDVEIELSLLTPLEKVANAQALTVGRDGTLLRKEGHSAIFLPAVAVEQGWDREQMLDQLCLKAGLAVGCWRQGADLYAFRAETLAESSEPATFNE